MLRSQILDHQAMRIVEAELASVVRRAAARPELGIVRWQAELLYGGKAETTSGIYRLSGLGRDSDGDFPWSVVLKAVRQAGSIDDPTRYDYWRREWLVYADAPALLPWPNDGLTAPRCYHAGEAAEGYWLWLEDVVETVERPWPLSRYALAARHLGTYGGRFLTDRPVPSYPWLASGLLATYTKGFEPEWARLAVVPDSPLLRRGWPRRQLERMRALSSERQGLLDALAAVPRVACHGDAYDRNLMARTKPEGVDQTVAIDWAYAGVGAIGEDLAVLLRSLIGGPDRGSVATFGRTLYESYVEGLRAAGWQGDARLARLGFALAAALRYAMNLAVGFTAALNDGELQQKFEQTFDVPFVEFLDRIVGLRDYCLDLADEARGLLARTKAETTLEGAP